MGRLFNLALLGAMIAGAIITYDMKHRAESAAEDVAGLHHEIDLEKDEIALLKAELSMLMQPGRIQQVVEQHADYFGLVPFSPEQIGIIEDIPMRTPITDTQAGRSATQLAAGFQDPSLAGEARQ